MIGKNPRKQNVSVENPDPTRAVRIDKLTLAGFEATLMDYLDEEKAVRTIPTLRMLLQKPEEIRGRAKKIVRALKRKLGESVRIEVMRDVSRAGGGALPERDLPTFVAAVSTAAPETRARRDSPGTVAACTPKKGTKIVSRSP